MFVALRDLRHAKGRFALIVLVVALLTLLVGFLTGLTAGLAGQNISALVSTDAERIVLAAPDDEAPAYATSTVSADQAATWRDAEGVTSVKPLGISMTQLRAGDAADGTSGAPVAVFAAEPGAFPDAPAADDAITLASATAERLGVGQGDEVVLAGIPLRVAAVVETEAYSHADVSWITLDAWHAVGDATGQGGRYATALAVDGGTDPAAVDAAAGTSSEALWPSLLQLESFKSEIGSLGLMIGMLIAISVLVVGVFFLVWTIQRQRDVAVLGALGGSARWLGRDAFGQALLVLVLGTAAGILATVGLGLLAGTALPFFMNWATLGLPAIGMIVAGLVGALVSVRRVTRVDPLVALGAGV